jgi:hypothetical protein
MRRPWFAIAWFFVWALFQTFAVTMVFVGKWRKPDAFLDESYFSLIYPDMLFIPLYYAAALLLVTRRQVGYVAGLIAGGAMTYVLVYLLALAHLHGTVNVIADSSFLICTVISVTELAFALKGRFQVA